ncbi:fumarate reductase iron-sulfur subunit [Candidatus Desulforudis audaxviator]|uniref:Succinate dehydrogenase and fumarate reductase iron-sulfur protein n=1 Tax=Desulforudis audaxviator (strain MP104C) TaxID=477974 RepID=B1I610_DESAP|nr:fumarate reductase iron-sulfur subunit [Candidatus Desulforudis audaxviator]ACA60423.1 succinate dehydrogenase and fumarate reductase iron-sulfur protein [Candidatus Desulforudis audaxviator MP104C]AZK60479.1 Succinate dehydrogenase iron-sulfur protein [Candidatus Desulforudis audaxviator]
MGRRLTFDIFRYHPFAAGTEPRTQTFHLRETPGMNIYAALTRIREEQDPSLMFDFVCRMALCGSCGMVINGRPRLACKTFTSHLPDRITLFPLPVFQLVGDLSVDTGEWFRHVSLKTGAWLHTSRAFESGVPEERMDNETALKIYEAERCIECGCCIAACAKVHIQRTFIGAAGINRLARFMLDPRDERSQAQYFEVLGSGDGIFGCMGLMGCEDNCPKDLPLQLQLAYVRRKMAAAGFGPRGNRRQ